MAADGDPSRVRAVEAQQKVHDGRLAAAGGADQADALARGGAEGHVPQHGGALLVGEPHVLEADGRAVGRGRGGGGRDVEKRYPGGGGRRDELALGGGLDGLGHDVEVVAGAGDGALGGVDDPAHHEHRLLGHVDHLQQHDHVAQREVPVQGAQEQRQVDAQEDHVHRRPAQRVHTVPEGRLRAGELDGAVEALGEGAQLAGLGVEGLGHLDLADDLCEAAAGDVDLVVLVGLDALPAAAGQGRQPHVDGEQRGEHERQWPVVDRRDGQHRGHGDQGGEEVVGEGLQELRHRGDRAVQPGDDGAGALGVEVALRQGQQLGEVPGGEHLAHAGGHHVADVAADVGGQGARQVHAEERDGQPDDGGHDGARDVAVVGERADDGVGGLAQQERRDQRERGGDHRGDEDPEVERPQRAGAADDAGQCVHGCSVPSWRRTGRG